MQAAASDSYPVPVLLGMDIPELGQLLRSNPRTVYVEGIEEAVVVMREQKGGAEEAGDDGEDTGSANERGGGGSSSTRRDGGGDGDADTSTGEETEC